MSVSRWLALVKSPGAAGHPPMPWFDVQSLSESDQRVVYAYIHELGAAGKAVPAYVPPGGKITALVIPFVPMKPVALPH